MWYEAAELIWTSIVGFFELPVPDKKVDPPYVYYKLSVIGAIKDAVVPHEFTLAFMV